MVAQSLNVILRTSGTHLPHGTSSRRRLYSFAPLRHHPRRRRARPTHPPARRRQGAGAALRRVEPDGVAVSRAALRGGQRMPSRSSFPTASATRDPDGRAGSTRRSSRRTPIARPRSSPSAAASSATWPASRRPPICAGIALVHVPTTLLAQVDSAIGGKVGVNHPLGKNLIGAFYQPHAVIVDPSVLGTLPRREFRAGLVRSHQVRHDLEPVAVRARGAGSQGDLRARAGGADGGDRRVVPHQGRRGRRRRKESGLRRILNFGHTAGHALEAVTKYRRFRHGEAVGYGMLVAAELARGARRTGRSTTGRRSPIVIASLGPLPPIGDISIAQMLDAMRHDKKMIAGRLHFVLPTAIGATAIVDDVTEKEMKRGADASGAAEVIDWSSTSSNQSHAAVRRFRRGRTRGPSEPAACSSPEESRLPGRVSRSPLSAPAAILRRSTSRKHPSRCVRQRAGQVDGIPRARISRGDRLRRIEV